MPAGSGEITSMSNNVIENTVLVESLKFVNYSCEMGVVYHDIADLCIYMIFI